MVGGPEGLEGLDRLASSSVAENETVRAILERRSHRDYDPDRAVARAHLETIVRCGLAAPSSKRAEPWRFHVVEDRSLLKVIADEAANAPGADDYVPLDPATGRPHEWASTVVASAAVLASAPAAVFVENRGTFSRGRDALLEATQARLIASLVGYTFEVLGVGAAIQNMVLAANSLGIQCCFMGDIVISEPMVKKLLHKMCGDFVGVLVVGYSVENLSPRPTVDVRNEPELAVWYGDDQR